jgi:hypothetical protein
MQLVKMSFIGSPFKILIIFEGLTLVIVKFFDLEMWFLPILKHKNIALC